jgi:hypothetical protein
MGRVVDTMDAASVAATFVEPSRHSMLFEPTWPCRQQKYVGPLSLVAVVTFHRTQLLSAQKGLAAKASAQADSGSVQVSKITFIPYSLEPSIVEARTVRAAHQSSDIVFTVLAIRSYGSKSWWTACVGGSISVTLARITSRAS